MRTSAPSPPSSVSETAPASRALPSTTSSPARPLTCRASLAPSECRMFVRAASPATTAPLAPPATVATSSPAVPSTVTASGAASPETPSGAARSAVNSLRSVPLRSCCVTASAPPRARKFTLSTSLRSIVTAATSRVNRTRRPFADRSMFSLTLAPLNASVSMPSWPSTVSLPSPGLQTNVTSSLPSTATSSPRPPVTVSFPRPAEDHIGAVAAGDRVVAVAAVDGQPQRQRGQARARRHPVLAALRVDEQALGLGRDDVPVAIDAEPWRIRGHADRVGTGRPVGGDAVDAVAAEGHDVEERRVGPDVVVAAERVDAQHIAVVVGPGD